MPNKLVQVVLGSNYDPPISRARKMMTCWVENRPDLRIGCKITLKDTDEPDRLWDVEQIGREHDRKDIKRGWGMTDYFVKEENRK